MADFHNATEITEYETDFPWSNRALKAAAIKAFWQIDDPRILKVIYTDPRHAWMMAYDVSDSL